MSEGTHGEKSKELENPSVDENLLFKDVLKDQENEPPTSTPETPETSEKRIARIIVGKIVRDRKRAKGVNLRFTLDQIMEEVNHASSGKISRKDTVEILKELQEAGTLERKEGEAEFTIQVPEVLNDDLRAVQDILKGAKEDDETLADLNTPSEEDFEEVRREEEEKTPVDTSSPDSPETEKTTETVSSTEKDPEKEVLEAHLPEGEKIWQALLQSGKEDFDGIDIENAGVEPDLQREIIRALKNLGVIERDEENGTHEFDGFFTDEAVQWLDDFLEKNGRDPSFQEFLDGYKTELQTEATTAPLEVETETQKAETRSIRESFSIPVLQIIPFNPDIALQNKAFVDFLEQSGQEIPDKTNPDRGAILETHYEHLRLRNEIRDRMRKLYEGKIDETFAVRLGSKDLAHVDAYWYEVAATAPEKLEEMKKRLGEYQASREKIELWEKVVKEKPRLEQDLKVIERAAEDAGSRRDEINSLRSLQGDVAKLLRESKGPTAWRQLINPLFKKTYQRELENVSTVTRRPVDVSKDSSLRELKRLQKIIAEEVGTLPSVEREFNQATQKATQGIHDVRAMENLEVKLDQLKVDFQKIESELLVTADLFTVAYDKARGYIQERIENIVDRAAGEDRILDADELTDLRTQIDQELATMKDPDALRIEYEDRIMIALEQALEKMFKNFRFSPRKESELDKLLDKILAYGGEGLDVALETLDRLVKKETNTKKKVELKFFKTKLLSTKK